MQWGVNSWETARDAALEQWQNGLNYAGQVRTRNAPLLAHTCRCCTCARLPCRWPARCLYPCTAATRHPLVSACVQSWRSAEREAWFQWALARAYAGDSWQDLRAAADKFWAETAEAAAEAGETYDDFINQASLVVKVTMKYLLQLTHWASSGSTCCTGLFATGFSTA